MTSRTLAACFAALVRALVSLSVAPGRVIQAIA